MKTDRYVCEMSWLQAPLWFMLGIYARESGWLVWGLSPLGVFAFVIGFLTVINGFRTGYLADKLEKLEADEAREAADASRKCYPLSGYHHFPSPDVDRCACGHFK